MLVKRDTFCEVLIVLCAVVNAYLFAGRIWRSYSYASLKHTESDAYTYAGDDYPEHLPLPQPTRPAAPVSFSLAPDAFPISGPGAAAQWASIYPPGYGFVRMGRAARLLCVAQFHQLHCVEKMRIYLDDPLGAGAHLGFAHQQHCMNYLRQLFLCAADRTLESLEPRDVVLAVGSDGGVDLDEKHDLATRSGPGVTHMCGDSKVLYEFVGDNYANWKAAWNISSPFDAEGDEHAGHSQ
ncbi:hypothetical protein DFH11DRAFT_1047466 [Phellopilus nigrolimitatus]|nr:hypothetical protein DFH11DRAFT_1047466 [Phellopilus nigrolimitatus]